MKTLKYFAGVILAMVMLMAAGIQAERLAVEDAGPVGIYRYDFTATADTLTNATSDTFEIPALLYSKWTYNWQIDATQISGTTNITCTLYEQADTDGLWVTIADSVDLDGTSSGFIQGEIVYGVKQRCVCTGTGTQSSQIDVYAVFKKD